MELKNTVVSESLGGRSGSHMTYLVNRLYNRYTRSQNAKVVTSQATSQSPHHSAAYWGFLG